MEKIVLVLPVILLVAVGCSSPSSQPTAEQNSPAEQAQIIQKTTPSTTPTNIQVISSPIPDYNPPLIKGMQVYNNTKLGFSIQYPPSAKPSLELNDGTNRLTKFGKSTSNYFEVRIEKDENSDIGMGYGYLEASITSQNIKLGGIMGYEAISETGYGDAGGQSSPYVEFGARYNGDVYHLIFFGQPSVSKQDMEILSSFKFIK